MFKVEEDDLIWFNDLFAMRINYIFSNARISAVPHQDYVLPFIFKRFIKQHSPLTQVYKKNFHSSAIHFNKGSSAVTGRQSNK